MTDMELNMSNLELGRGGAMKEHIEPEFPVDEETREDFWRELEEMKRLFRNERDHMTLPSAI